MQKLIKIETISYLIHIVLKVLGKSRMTRRLEDTEKSGFERLFSFIIGCLKNFHRYKLSPPKKIKEIRKERGKVVLLYSFKNNLAATLIALCLLAYSLFIQDHAYFLLIFGFAGLMLYPFLFDLSFYASYYATWEAVTRLILSSKNGGQKSDSNLEYFQITYNDLRNSIKKRIRSSHGNLLTSNLLTYDYEISRIAHDIDTFFDATTKILFKKKAMAIPFSPYDAYDKFMELFEIQSRSTNELENVEHPPSEYAFDSWEIKDINFNPLPNSSSNLDF